MKNRFHAEENCLQENDIGSSSSSFTFKDADEHSIAQTSPEKKCIGRGKTVTYGSASIVGRRRDMEDAVSIVSPFMNRSCSEAGGCLASSSSSLPGEISGLNFFGVYDGHGGSQVARYCAERIHQVVVKEWEGRNGETKWQKRWVDSFSSCFDRVDNEMSGEGGISPVPDIIGSTAVAVIVTGCQIIASNCGDSRAILCRGNQTIALTNDHKPNREDELLRIEAAGGRVINWNGPRVRGVLAMSRAIGDRYLRPWVIPVPEITFTTRNEEDECLIIASDGLWDVMSNEEVAEVVCHLLRRRSSPPLQIIAEHLTELAYRKNSSDNISVIVVDLKSKRRKPKRR